MNRRSLLAYVLLAAAALLLGVQLRRVLSDTSFWPPDDFIEYWCAGTFNLRGENPYDYDHMYAFQRDHDWKDIGHPVMMWNPPWTLTLAMPLGLMPWRVAQFAWFLLKLGVLAFCADRIWRLYRGPEKRAWIAWAVTFTFLPTLIALRDGQVSPFLLLGAVLFVAFEKAGRPFWAGVVCVLLAIKPHLAYLFWLAVALDALSRHRFAIVLGGFAGGVACSLWPLIENPAVFDQYLAAARDHPPAQWMSPTVGSLLRLAFGEERFWLQYVSMAAGFAWFAYDWIRHRDDWDWAERIPWLLFVSFATAPYGAWPYDLTLLLLPLLGLAARLADAPRLTRFRAAAAFLAINLGMFAVNFSDVTSVWFIWAAPALLAAAVAVEKRLPSPRVAPA
jgi:hypothetical protein